MKFYLHVNYYEGEGKLKKLFKIAEMNGYDGVELRGKYKFQDMNQSQYQEKVIELKQRHPDMGISFGTYVELLQEQAKAERDIEEYLEFLEWAKNNCGTECMNFQTGQLLRPGASYLEFDRNGSSLAREKDFEKVASGLKIIAAKAEELDIKVALETHVGYIHDLPQSCDKLMKMVNSKALGINFDYGNIYSNKNGCGIKESIDIMADKIYYAHLKNLKKCENGVRVHASLEEGHINNCEILENLKAINFNGIVVPEYPATGDGFIMAKRDMEYIILLKEWLGL